jgi:hypothetical protein
LGTNHPLSSFREAFHLKRWVVYTKPPFHSPEPLFRYLGRYTHRIGFANHRLLSIGPDSVRFTVRARDPLSGHRSVILSGPEFLRRLFLHVLPKGFVRIRHFGLYATSHQHSHLQHARRILAPPPPLHQNDSPPPPSPPRPVCPHCGHPLIRRLLPRSTFYSSSSTRAPPHVA